MKTTQPEIDIIKLESRASAVEARMKTVEDRQERMESRQDTLEKRADTLDIRLEPRFKIEGVALAVITTAVVGALVYLIANQLAKG